MSAYGNEQLTLKGYLKGHTNWVTQIATNPQYPDLLFSSSRGKKCKLLNILTSWNLKTLILCESF